MLVRTWMTKDPLTIAPTASMKEAMDLMREHEIRHLPVVDDGRLVGMVTLTDIRRASPSPATTFSIGEVNYLVDQIRVQDIMTPDPVSTTPDTTVEDAALLGYKHQYGSMPVVEDGKLVGIITSADLFNIMMRVFFSGEDQTRITIEDLPPTLGTMRQIVDILDKHGAYFSSILSFPQPQQNRFTYWIRIARSSVEPVVADLKAAGFPATHVA
jgi:acetoin utilization protein AcuB